MEKINLFSLLKTGTHEQIKNELLNELYKIGTYCTDIIGEGGFGKVSIPSVGPFFTIKIDDEYITIPIVIKETKNLGVLNIDDININSKKNLIINANLGITAEAIMLYMISKYWYKSINIHLPFMIGFGNCSEDIGTVTHIILERHGLPNRIEITYQQYVRPIQYINNINSKKFSYMVTCYDVFQYMALNCDNEFKCMLFGETVYIPYIVDYYCIFYIHTSEFLWNNLGMTLGDQHFNNIYIHWINDMSRCGKRNIENLKNIYYEISNNKYLKMSTHGLIYKIGDIGISTMKLQDDVIIIGDLMNKNNLNDVLLYKNKTKTYVDTLIKLYSIFQPAILKKTKFFNLFESDKYLSQSVPFVGYKKEYTDMMSELDILNHNIYSEWHTDKAIDNHENFIIKLNAPL